MTSVSVSTALPGTRPPLRDELEHLAPLDGIRAVAILLVLVHHLLPLHLLIPHEPGLRPGQVVPPLGFWGISLFFVLSGFLITRILLAAREDVDLGRATLGRQLGAFYFRRTLRIFPLYYGTLLVLWLLDVPEVRERILWHATYLSNWLLSDISVYREGGYERHFWTLAVEEQFYLIWPWLVLLTPRRLLVWALGGVFLLGPLWRAWFALRVGTEGQMWPWTWTVFPTPANFDLLAGGALLALAWKTRFHRPMLWVALAIGLPGAAAAAALFNSDMLIATRQILAPTAWTLLFVAWIGFAAGGVPVMSRLLALGPMRYLGKTSYAMYVFHTLMPPLLAWLVVRAGITGDAGLAGLDAVKEGAIWLEERLWLKGWVTLAMTVGLAALSWHLFEGPINRLKARLPYRRQ